MLEAREVAKRYAATTALEGVSLEVTEGECVALVGESGSGKTTLLRMVNRMVEPDAGRVLVGGDDVASVNVVALRRSIGYVPQEGGLLPHWRVLRNVALVPWLLLHADADDAARRALELVGLSADFAHRWPTQLSGGQRQRVAIARALAAQPRVLLLDEPFGALDAITRADLHDMFAALRARLHITTLLVTHDMREAALLADRIAVMRAGGIEQVATPSELFAQPATEYVARLVEKSGAAAA
jgi:osmoprotectant transport system ATP-binding protein